MLFHSQFFVLVFLPIAVIAYYSVASSPMLRQWVLIAASLAFYSWWDVRFIPLLVVQIGATWLLAILAERLQAPVVVTLDRRHFATVKPRHCGAFELLP